LAHCQAQHDRDLTHYQTQSHLDLASTQTRVPRAWHTIKLNRVWVWLVPNPTLLGIAHCQAQSCLGLTSGRPSVSGAWLTAKSNCIWVWLALDLVCPGLVTLPSSIMFGSN
jgi:D-alanyl-lipoteichoic acid acyltransferase DltB (MBOAT superfamily)